MSPAPDLRTQQPTVAAHQAHADNDRAWTAACQSAVLPAKTPLVSGAASSPAPPGSSPSPCADRAGSSPRRSVPPLALGSLPDDPQATGRASLPTEFPLFSRLHPRGKAFFGQSYQSPVKSVLQDTALVAGNQPHGDSLSVANTKATRQTPASALNRSSFRSTIRLPFSVSTPERRPSLSQRRNTDKKFVLNGGPEIRKLQHEVRVELDTPRHRLSMAQK
jgi:hypothetical protein